MQVADCDGHTNVIENMCGLNKAFLAPEVLKTGTKSVVTTKADVYSVGTILYSLLFKDLPLEDNFNSS